MAGHQDDKWTKASMDLTRERIRLLDIKRAADPAYQPTEAEVASMAVMDDAANWAEEESRKHAARLDLEKAMEDVAAAGPDGRRIVTRWGQPGGTTVEEPVYCKVPGRHYLKPRRRLAGSAPTPSGGDEMNVPPTPSSTLALSLPAMDLSLIDPRLLEPVAPVAPEDGAGVVVPAAVPVVVEPANPMAVAVEPSALLADAPAAAMEAVAPAPGSQDPDVLPAVLEAPSLVFSGVPSAPLAAGPVLPFPAPTSAPSLAPAPVSPFPGDFDFDKEFESLDNLSGEEFDLLGQLPDLDELEKEVGLADGWLDPQLAAIAAEDRVAAQRRAAIAEAAAASAEAESTARAAVEAVQAAEAAEAAAEQAEEAARAAEEEEAGGAMDAASDAASDFSEGEFLRLLCEEIEEEKKKLARGAAGSTGPGPSQNSSSPSPAPGFNFSFGEPPVRPQISGPSGPSLCLAPPASSVFAPVLPPMPQPGIPSLTLAALTAPSFAPPPTGHRVPKITLRVGPRPEMPAPVVFGAGAAPAAAPLSVQQRPLPGSAAANAPAVARPVGARPFSMAPEMAATSPPPSSPSARASIPAPTPGEAMWRAVQPRAATPSRRPAQAAATRSVKVSSDMDLDEKPETVGGVEMELDEKSVAIADGGSEMQLDEKPVAVAAGAGKMKLDEKPADTGAAETDADAEMQLDEKPVAESEAKGEAIAPMELDEEPVSLEEAKKALDEKRAANDNAPMGLDEKPAPAGDEGLARITGSLGQMSFGVEDAGTKAVAVEKAGSTKAGGTKAPATVKPKAPEVPIPPVTPCKTAPGLPEVERSPRRGIGSPGSGMALSPRTTRSKMEIDRAGISKARRAQDAKRAYEKKRQAAATEKLERARLALHDTFKIEYQSKEEQLKKAAAERDNTLKKSNILQHTVAALQEQLIKKNEEHARTLANEQKALQAVFDIKDKQVKQLQAELELKAKSAAELQQAISTVFTQIQERDQAYAQQQATLTNYIAQREQQFAQYVAQIEAEKQAQSLELQASQLFARTLQQELTLAQRAARVPPPVLIFRHPVDAETQTESIPSQTESISPPDTANHPNATANTSVSAEPVDVTWSLPAPAVAPPISQTKAYPQPRIHLDPYLPQGNRDRWTVGQPEQLRFAPRDIDLHTLAASQHQTLSQPAALPVELNPLTPAEGGQANPPANPPAREPYKRRHISEQELEAYRQNLLQREPQVTPPRRESQSTATGPRWNFHTQALARNPTQLHTPHLNHGHPATGSQTLANPIANSQVGDAEASSLPLILPSDQMIESASINREPEDLIAAAPRSETQPEQQAVDIAADLPKTMKSESWPTGHEFEDMLHYTDSQHDHKKRKWNSRSASYNFPTLSQTASTETSAAEPNEDGYMIPKRPKRSHPSKKRRAEGPDGSRLPKRRQTPLHTAQQLEAAQMQPVEPPREAPQDAEELVPIAPPAEAAQEIVELPRIDTPASRSYLAFAGTFLRAIPGIPYITSILFGRQAQPEEQQVAEALDARVEQVPAVPQVVVQNLPTLVEDIPVVVPVTDPAYPYLPFDDNEEYFSDETESEPEDEMDDTTELEITHTAIANIEAQPETQANQAIDVEINHNQIQVVRAADSLAAHTIETLIDHVVNTENQVATQATEDEIDNAHIQDENVEMQAENIEVQTENIEIQVGDAQTQVDSAHIIHETPVETRSEQAIQSNNLPESAPATSAELGSPSRPVDDPVQESQEPPTGALALFDAEESSLLSSPPPSPVLRSAMKNPYFAHTPGRERSTVTWQTGNSTLEFDSSLPIRPDLAPAAETPEKDKHQEPAADIPSTGPVLMPLTESQLDLLKKAIGGSEPKVVAHTVTGDNITAKAFHTVIPKWDTPSEAWLNDEIINNHLLLSVQHGQKLKGLLTEERLTRRQTKTPKYFTYNSFFYSRLSEQGFGSVASWGRPIRGEKLLSVEKLFIPVNNGVHWTLAVASPMAKTIEYLDSMAAGNAATRKKVIDTLLDFLKNDLGQLFVRKEWRVLKTTCPQQENGWDCGVFTVTNAVMVVRGLPLNSYSQADMPEQRRRILVELMEKRLLV
ncbi:MAG: Smt3-specific protease [Trizodia sp. TS-e1964]|nr:MAG: Smt3-specific protease [Trizodia sp. TS-e1964]